MATANFSHVLSLNTAADRLIEVCGELIDESVALPWWAWWRRRRAVRASDLAFLMAISFKEHARDQQAAIDAEGAA